MSGPNSTQIMSVTLDLAGQQSARADAVNVGTPEAQIHLLWGALMLTFTSAGQGAHVHQAFVAAQVHARRLPMALGRGVPTLSRIDPRIERPGVVMRLWGQPLYTVAYVAQYQERTGKLIPQHAVIALGGITWNVYDQTAHRSTLGILHQATKVSSGVFG
jgi:hypothetical protein